MTETQSVTQVMPGADSQRPKAVERVEEGRLSRVLQSRALHVLVLLAGTALLVAGAFHGNVWFDESYSVAIANHSFADIWGIGSGDVHPVLYYWALHVLNLAFGQNLVVYRLFTLAGSVALAALGLTHLRRDFGWRVGLLFSLFALFTPYVAVMAVQIRMYSWTTFAVMVCCIYAFRIASVLRERPWQPVARQAEGLRTWAGAPARWWVALFASGLACAYLHYYGALAAFMVHLVLLVFLVSRAVRNRKAKLRAGGGAPIARDAGGGRDTGRAAGAAGQASVAVQATDNADRKAGMAHLSAAGEGAADDSAAVGSTSPRPGIARRLGSSPLAVFWLGAAAEVAAYAPWLSVLASQIDVVSGAYWATLTFPATFFELTLYPVLTSAMNFGLRGEYGAFWQTVLNSLGTAARVLVVAWALWVVWQVGKRFASRRRAAAGAGSHVDAHFGGADAPAASSFGSALSRLPFARAMGLGSRKMTAAPVMAGAAGGVGAGAVAPQSVLGPSGVRPRLGGRLRAWLNRLEDSDVMPAIAALVVYAGVAVIALIASLLMDSLILYYRYLFISIGPLLFACAVALTHVRSRVLVGCACALVLVTGVVAQYLYMQQSYDESNDDPIVALQETVDDLSAERGGDQPLVISSDIGFQGVASVMLPDIEEQYMDWQAGNWGLAYQCYAPTLTVQDTWEDILVGYSGSFVVLGQSSGDELPRTVTDLEAKGYTLVEYQTYYRPYECARFTIAVMSAE